MCEFLDEEEGKVEEIVKSYEKLMYLWCEEFVKVFLNVFSLGNLINGD